MKLNCFKQREQRPHLQIIEFVELDVTLEEAIERDLRPIRTDVEIHANKRRRRRKRRPWRRMRGRRRGNNPWSTRVGPMCLRSNGNVDEEPFDGLIVYSSRAALIEFMLQRWEPIGDSGVDNLIRRMRQDRRMSVAARRVELEKIIEQLEESRFDSGPPLLAADEIDLMDSCWCRLDRLEGLFYAHVDNEALVVTCDWDRTIGGQAVRCYEWLVVSGGIHESVLHLRGGLMRRDTVGNVPGPVLRRFDARGTAQVGLLADLLPLHELWPRFLIRVPADTPGADSVGDVDPALPACMVVEPWRFPDLRRLQEDLPVIEDPAAATAVLGRTLEGLFLPGSPPLGDVELPRESLLVGALPFPDRRQLARP